MVLFLLGLWQLCLLHLPRPFWLPLLCPLPPSSSSDPWMLALPSSALGPCTPHCKRCPTMVFSTSCVRVHSSRSSRSSAALPSQAPDPGVYSLKAQRHKRSYGFLKTRPVQNQHFLSTSAFPPVSPYFSGWSHQRPPCPVGHPELSVLLIPLLSTYYGPGTMLSILPTLPPLTRNSSYLRQEVRHLDVCQKCTWT